MPLLKAAGFVNGKETCSGDCALCVKYDIEDCNREYYTGCAFAVNANATVAIANITSSIDDEMEETVSELSFISANMP